MLNPDSFCDAILERCDNLRDEYFKLRDRRFMSPDNYEDLTNEINRNLGARTALCEVMAAIRQIAKKEG